MTTPDPATTQRISDFLTAMGHMPDNFVVLTVVGRDLTLGDLRALAGPPASDPLRPAHLLVGPVPLHDPPPCEHGVAVRGTEPLGGRLLVTVWPNGTGEVAWRGDHNLVWGPPAPLTPAP